jgi:hypothetical protein
VVAGLADPDILALAQVGIDIGIDVGQVHKSWRDNCVSAAGLMFMCSGGRIGRP